MEGALHVIRGKRQGEIFTLRDDQRLTIGRDISSDIQMFDPGLSRSHMMVENTPSGVVITDLNSSNGTYINGTRILKATLDFGDIIHVGEAQIRFEESVPKVSEDPLADMVQNLFDETEPRIKKRFKASDSGLIDLSGLGATGEKSAAIAKNLETIYKVSAVVNTTEDLDSIFTTLMDTIYDVFKADRSFLIMHNPEKGVLEPVVIRKSPKDRTSERKLNISTNIVKESVKNGMSLLSSDAMQDDRFKAGDSIIMNHIRSVMCVPVEARSKILGAIYVDSVSFTNQFSEEDLELLTAIGRQAGVAIRRAKLIEDLEDLYYNLVQTLVATIEAKDEYTRGHSERVTRYALALGETMRLKPDALNTIRLGGLLHDIGKIGIPENVLNKPGKLTNEEYDILKKHPVMGAQILKNITDLDESILVVLHHHEHFNGRGYPDGLKGEDIPLSARILAVADAFDAMTSKRPYRPVQPMDYVMDELRNNLGTQFDRKIAEVFIWMLEKGKISPEQTESMKPLDG